MLQDSGISEGAGHHGVTKPPRPIRHASLYFWNIDNRVCFTAILLHICIFFNQFRKDKFCNHRNIFFHFESVMLLLPAQKVKGCCVVLCLLRLVMSRSCLPPPAVVPIPTTNVIVQMNTRNKQPQVKTTNFIFLHIFSPQISEIFCAWK